MKITMNEIKQIVKKAINEQMSDPVKNDLYWSAIDNLEKRAQELASEGLLDAINEKGDDGIGPYEYAGRKGWDSRKYNELTVEGEYEMAWTGDVDVESFEATVLIDNSHDVDVEFTLKGPRTYNPEDDESLATFKYYGSATLSDSDGDDDDAYDRRYDR